MTNNTKFSGIAIAAGLFSLCSLGLGAVLFVGNDASMERLGLFFALLSPAVLGLVGALRADQGAKQTNGSLDARIQEAVYQANAVRRKSDVTPPEADNPESPVKP